MILKAGQYEFRFPRPVLVMGVVNVTPDSFSDGGLWLDPGRAIEQACRLAEEGADILDIGGESTRPLAGEVSTQEELRRVLPVLEGLADKTGVPISIDTQKTEVAREALARGVSIINDVAANREDPSMWRLVAESGAGYVVMHMQGTPQTMQANPHYENVVDEVNNFFGNRLEKLKQEGVSLENLILDPGLGFGKTGEHNLQLLGKIERFTRWNRPVLLGASRKSFLGKVAGGAPSERLGSGLACACWAALNGVQIIRTHDVAATCQTLRMLEAVAANRT